MSDKPQVLVCQRGARHRYAIASLLEEAGMLSALYTDSSAYSFAGKLAKGLGEIGVGPSRLRALSSRMPRGVPREKVFSTDRALYAALPPVRKDADLSATYMQWGMQGATVVYSMYGEEFEFLQWAKKQGAKIMVDVFVHPATSRIVAEESSRHSGSNKSHSVAPWRLDCHSKWVFELADLLLCPSQWVADGVRDFLPECADKIRLIPYGSSIDAVPAANGSPAVGRILFAGRDPLRKGLHYLAEAVSLARGKIANLDVHVAGVAANEVDWIEHKNELNCLGTIPMDQMHREFSQADVLVLPSLSEGQAGVVLEAMACGCPVIATRESGIDFKPGCGVTVPVRNAGALAEAICDVVGNREKRQGLAEGALRQSADYTMDAWKQRLVNTVEEIESI